MPSGIWAETEYVKLVDYDKPTSEQPFGIFLCHDGDRKDTVCRGWSDCHSQNPPGHELLSGRFTFGRGGMPAPSDVPCFASGQEAHDHGVADIEEPDDEAERRIELLMEKHPDIKAAAEGDE